MQIAPPRQAERSLQMEAEAHHKNQAVKLQDRWMEHQCSSGVLEILAAGAQIMQLWLEVDRFFPSRSQGGICRSSLSDHIKYALSSTSFSHGTGHATGSQGESQLKAVFQAQSLVMRFLWDVPSERHG